MGRQTRPGDRHLGQPHPTPTLELGAQAVGPVSGRAPATLHISTHSAGAAGSHTGKCSRPDLTMLPARVGPSQLSNTEFSEAMGTSHQRGRRCLGTILRRRSGLAVQGHLSMWMWAQNNPQIPANRWCTHYLHMCTHPSWRTGSDHRHLKDTQKEGRSPPRCCPSTAVPSTGCFPVGAHRLTL